MVPIVTIVNFLHHFLSFVWSGTSQIRVGVEPGVGFLVQDVPEKHVPSGQVLELPCFRSVIGERFVFQVGNDGVPPLW